MGSESSAELRHIGDQTAIKRLTPKDCQADNPGAAPELFSLQLLLATFAGFVNRRQAEATEYLREENRVLSEQLGGKRLRLTSDQRCRLAAKGERLGRRLLCKLATVVTPDTILRWHRQLIAASPDYS